MGPGGYGWYKNIGDIEKVEDTNNPIKNSFKIILKQPKDGKSNLGSWTYDSDSNQLIQTAGGDFEIPNSGNTAAPAPAPTPQQDEMKEFESYVKQLWGADSKTTDTYYKRGNTFIADDGESEFEFVRDGNSFRQTK
jgi:hypothetical protein